MNPEVGTRVRIIDPLSDAWGMHGTVKLIDRHQQLWIHIDGTPEKQYVRFTRHGVTVANQLPG